MKCKIQKQFSGEESSFFLNEVARAVVDLDKQLEAEDTSSSDDNVEVDGVSS